MQQRSIKAVASILLLQAVGIHSEVLQGGILSPALVLVLVVDLVLSSISKICSVLSPAVLDEAEEEAHHFKKRRCWEKTSKFRPTSPLWTLPRASRKTVQVDIPGGVEDGMRLRLSGEGDAPVTGMAANPKARSTRGDLYVFIRVAPDSRFSRSGVDVLYTASIPLTTALLGGEVTVPTLDGEVKVKVATGTGTGDKITLGGMGMKRLSGRGPPCGDLRVEFKVNMPKYLSANQRTILEMLADEMNDKTAKRIMGLDKMRQQ